MEMTETERQSVREHLGRLRAANVTTVTANYDGCGDSGTIENVAVEVAGDQISDQVQTLAEAAVEAVLEACYGNWEDGDGSSGKITLLLDHTPARIEIEHSYPVLQADHDTLEFVLGT